ncbi:hypothetical protein ANCCAN_06700 [Ancylostoma caninum]|uniref:Uncharacterized protein n=1 Tax=Ancylostoma caninum TaxID=29170 RepID=A0A368GUI2_ANCCA|nr:hypothetical protein ANCCAN_06700 [Ancylostoma caninum]
MVFLFDDFDSEVFQNFAHTCPEAPVFGTPLIRSRIYRGLHLPRLRPRRPLYCDILRNINVIIGYGDENERRHWTKLIRYMGGHVKKEV